MQKRHAVVAPPHPKSPTRTRLLLRHQIYEFRTRVFQGQAKTRAELLPAWKLSWVWPQPQRARCKGLFVGSLRPLRYFGNEMGSSPSQGSSFGITKSYMYLRSCIELIFFLFWILLSSPTISIHDATPGHRKHRRRSRRSRPWTDYSTLHTRHRLKRKRKIGKQGNPISNTITVLEQNYQVHISLLSSG
jgi:hypothetical protein